MGGLWSEDSWADVDLDLNDVDGGRMVLSALMIPDCCWSLVHTSAEEHTFAGTTSPLQQQ